MNALHNTATYLRYAPVFLRNTRPILARRRFATEEQSKTNVNQQDGNILKGSSVFGEEGVLGFKFDEIDFRARYGLITGSILPRPIAFVSTCTADGKIRNLASFSFFMPVTADPPTLAFSVTRKLEGKKKDTLVNIQTTKHFVVNHVSQAIFTKAYKASAEFPPEVDEFEAVGLTPVPSLYGPAPRVHESPLSLECSLYNQFEIGDGSYGSSTIIVGKILYAFVDPTCFKDGRLQGTALNTVSRLGGLSYGGAERHFEIHDDDVWTTKHW